MSIKEAIEAIAASMSVTNTFRYGTLDETNVFGDDDIVLPVIYLLAILQTNVAFGNSLGIKDSTPLNIYFLDKCDFGEYANETQAIRDRQLSYLKEFMTRMSLYRTPDGSKYFLISPGDIAKAIAVYDTFDVNMTGQRLEISVQTMYKDPACDAIG